VLKRFPPILSHIGSIFHNAGFQVFLVGGAIRNSLMNLPLSDYDLATDALPEDVKKLFHRVIPTGIKHGTVTVHYGGQTFEITTFRVDGAYTNQRHPDSVSFSSSLPEDLRRRDLTINAIALNLYSGELVDPTGGQRDIRERIIRAIGNPAERFNEDGLRLLRAVRFACELNFTLEGETRRALALCKDNLRQVSWERIRDELNKMLASPAPSRSFFIMEEAGLLPLIIPELSRCRGLEQKGRHRFDVFEHSLHACDGAPRDNPAVRLAALLHDIGKPLTLGRDEEGLPTFYRHEEESRRLAEEILTRLKYPKAVSAQVCHLIRYHMFHYESCWSDGAVRRFLAAVGIENWPDLLALRRADSYGAGLKTGASDENLGELDARINRALEVSRALTVKDLRINGNILAREGIPKGPVMGRVINFLLETVLDDPGQNTPEILLPLARRFYETRINLKG
jgi:poly(A) polymerase/tRNA nucleotidyltransferase (CCA-adding enzyme)